MMSRFVIFLFWLLTLCYGVFGEVVNSTTCAVYNTPCINEVRVTPCREAPLNKPCRVKRGKDAAIEVDFTPFFNSEKLKSQAYWDNGIIDIPLVGMETDACKTATCPIVKDSKQTYKYALNIASSYPIAPYTVKWKLTGDEGDQVCCFKIKIRLVR